MENVDRHTKKHIVFLGESEFPGGLGAIQRMTLVAKSLLHAGCDVLVICRKGGSRDDSKVNFPPEGHFEGIRYIYTSGVVTRPTGFLKRSFMKLKGMCREFLYLKRLKKENNLSAAIISNHSAFHLIRYRLYSWIIGFPIVLNFVEMASVMKSRKRFGQKINDHFYDRYLVRIVDGALPISEKLLNYYQSLSPGKPSLKLPILCDFDKFQYAPRTDTDVIFLYCGAASYFELVDFVLKAFDKLEGCEGNVFLDLVLGGTDQQLQKISERIELAKNRAHIRFISNVPHEDIPGYYSKASALLIPLRPTLQDEARFPHKIGEYLASGRPMITTSYGEIRHYDFMDEETALIADDYNETAFAEKMKFITTHPSESESIGKKGREMGLKNFDYTSHGNNLLNYFIALEQGK